VVRWLGGGAMIDALAAGPFQIRYELRFMGLFDKGCGYAFPCDALGHVDIDALSERARDNYLFARAVVGSVLAAPVVSKVP